MIGQMENYRYEIELSAYTDGNARITSKEWHRQAILYHRKGGRGFTDVQQMQR